MKLYLIKGRLGFKHISKIHRTLVINIFMYRFGKIIQMPLAPNNYTLKMKIMCASKLIIKGRLTFHNFVYQFH